MALTFEKRVKRMQKWVLGIIVAVMVLSLVMWGYGPSTDGEGKADQAVGTYMDRDVTVTVTRKGFNEQYRKARAYTRYKVFEQYAQHPQGRQFIKQICDYGWGRMFQEQPESVIQQQTQEMLVLLRRARENRLVVSSREFEKAAQWFWGVAGLTGGEPDEAYSQLTQRVFGVNLQTYEGMLRDALLIEKNLDFEVAGPNVKFREIYQDLIEESHRARVAVAAIDPERFAALPTPITSEAIAKRYEDKTHQKEYEVPDKVQVEFLMAAFEALKAAQPEPSEEEIKKYYEDNKEGMFSKTGAEGEQGGFKTLDEVRNEIRDKIKLREARQKSHDTLVDVNREIGDKVDAVKAQVEKELQGKPELERLDQIADERMRETDANWFAELKQQHARVGVDLTHDITVLFEEKRLDDAVKLLGKIARSDQEARFKKWAFSAKVGEIQKGEILETDKGWCVVRLARKVDKYIPDLTEPVRQQIVKDLTRENAQAAARKLAGEIVGALNGGSLAPQQRLIFEPTAALRSVGSKYGVTFVESDYFGPAGAGLGAEDSTLGLGDSTLASSVRQRTFQGNAPQASQAFTLDGSADKQLWSYVVFVEDVVNVTPENLEGEFRRKVADEEEGKRAQARTVRIEEMMKAAGYRDVTKENKGAD